MDLIKKIEALKKQRAETDEAITRLKQLESKQEKEDRYRIESLIGRVMREEGTANQETKTFIMDFLQKGIKGKRDITFLQNKGWLKIDAPENEQNEVERVGEVVSVRETTSIK